MKRKMADAESPQKQTAVTDWTAEITKRLQAAFPEAQEIKVVCTDQLSGKFACRVVDVSFTGKMPVARHRAVMKAVGLSSTDESSETNVAVHALSIDAASPSEVKKD